MRLRDFHYELPTDLIAQHPLEDRSASRLLVLDRIGDDGGHRILDRVFTDLPRFLRAGDLLVFNNTRVMRARLFGRKETGGAVEILVERVLGPRAAFAQIRAGKPPRPGSFIALAGGGRVRVEGREEGLYRLEAEDSTFDVLMATQGHIPLPPYIHRPDDALDEARYQTVYASRRGAVAAPTAGLHFDTAMLAVLDAIGVGRIEITLHVGAGTFQPVRVDEIDRHRMHAEWLEVDESVCRRVGEVRRDGGRIVAVGTTSVRGLETAAANGELEPFRGDSRLFIRPGYRFRVVDALLTNFHLPESTLLMLVCAFAGYHEVMSAYRHAVAARYRFFSYGDAMFLKRS